LDPDLHLRNGFVAIFAQGNELVGGFRKATAIYRFRKIVISSTNAPFIHGAAFLKVGTDWAFGAWPTKVRDWSA
jgi:hypothetical protein